MWTALSHGVECAGADVAWIQPTPSQVQTVRLVRLSCEVKGEHQRGRGEPVGQLILVVRAPVVEV